MTSLLDGLDLKDPIKPIGPQDSPTWRMWRNKQRKYNDNLRRALEAALAVIDAEGEYTRGPHAKQKQHDLTEELKLRLMPFRKEGLG